ncbi:MAG TPA: TraR/DksA C4-type zinc finger protein [Jatrophihabitans sp.]|jgi:DnaK suppressor protein
MNDSPAGPDSVDGNPAALRQRLVADRDGTVAHIEALNRDLTGIIESVSAANTDDEHDPEGTTLAFERAQVIALVDQAQGHLADLEVVLRRLDAGDYGTCEQCGKPIAAERLLARPSARTCIVCASSTRR